MKCPFRKSIEASHMHGGDTIEYFEDCIKEECMAWDVVDDKDACLRLYTVVYLKKK